MKILKEKYLNLKKPKLDRSTLLLLKKHAHEWDLQYPDIVTTTPGRTTALAD